MLEITLSTSETLIKVIIDDNGYVIGIPEFWLIGFFKNCLDANEDADDILFENWKNNHQNNVRRLQNLKPIILNMQTGLPLFSPELGTFSYKKV